MSCGDTGQIDGLVQERRNSIANALKLRIFALTHRNMKVIHRTPGENITGTFHPN